MSLDRSTTEERAHEVTSARPDPLIGTLNEGSLHASLKDLYAAPGDELEARLGRFVIDIRRKGPDGDELIEIQTGSFGAMGNKLDHLLPDHRILLVHPIATVSTLVRGDKRRRSPKRGRMHDLFGELVSIPTLLDHPNLTLDVVLVEQDKVQVHDPAARRRRGGYRTVDRRLTQVVETRRFETARDLLDLLPDGLPSTFTTADIAECGQLPRDTARRIAYCMRALAFFDEVGRTRAGIEYRLST